MKPAETERERINIFTVDDLRWLTLKSSSSQVLDHQKVRLVPLEVVTTASVFFSQEDRPRKTAAYIISCYEFYRGCVCWGRSDLGVPLVKKDDVLEWPQPADFRWTDTDSVYQFAKAAGRGFENNGLDWQVGFVINNLDSLYFMDMPDWQEDENRYLLRPLKRIVEGKSKNDMEGGSELTEILTRLTEPFEDVFVKKYYF